MTPNARTLARLRKLGYTADIVERRLPRGFITKDLLGCIDVVAVHPQQKGVLGVQATTRDHQAHRLAKALAEPRLRTWLQAGNAFHVWGWALVGKRGKRKLWDVAMRIVTLDDLN